MLGRLFIHCHTAGDHRETGAEFQRHGGGHGAMHAKASCRIIGGADNAAAVGATAYRQRDVAHFDRCKKASHIDMYDFTHPAPLICTSIQ